ncbi:VOC family protein [uncultured Tenacibaculum sp.]|uniref:VOC family protein n=1 Tax=uncultured Tenacibaculum sp. TaxID=174713 RepID=UPI002624CDD0|nr:VOC family protein [uncultured Tenacibaculum sp.]
MKVSHILYKVKNLDAGVEKFRQEGFTVEYGTKKKPYNAIIYFSEGPYLELIGAIKLPSIISFLMKLFGKGKVVERINNWHYSKEGLIAVCLENYKTNLSQEKKILTKYNQKYFERPSKRLDIKNRLLKFKVLFPNELKIPFLMTYFNIDPKPKNYVHTNGIKKIKSISFGTEKEFIPLINELCDDDTLKLFLGEGVKDLEYEKQH